MNPGVKSISIFQPLLSFFTKSRPGRMFKDQKQGISVRGRNWQGKWKTPFLSGIPWISGNLRFRKNAKKL